MLGQALTIDVFEATFADLYKYVYRRTEDKEFIADILKEIYISLSDLNELDKDKALLVAYQLAYSLLSKRNLISTPEDFWSSLSPRETETLRLRFLEELSTFEIAFVLQEQAGKLDAFLYATLMKLQDIFSPISKKQFVGAYFSDVHTYFKKMKEKEEIEPPQDLKLELGRDLFEKEYNTGRDYRLPEREDAPLADENVGVKERSEVKDFFNKPMEDKEKVQFSTPPKTSLVNEAPDFIKRAAEVEDRHPEWALREEEAWVPENKPTALPKENPEGYGMDLLKTFSKQEADDMPVNEREFPDPLAEKTNPEIGASESEYGVPDELRELEQEAGFFQTLRKSVLSPIIALIIVVSGTLFWPFESDTEKFLQEYNVYYGEGFSFEQRKDLVDNVLNELIASRDVKDIYVDRLTEKNVQVTFHLRDAQKDGEIFVFYKMDDGRWAARKYYAVTK